MKQTILFFATLFLLASCGDSPKPTPDNSNSTNTTTNNEEPATTPEDDGPPPANIEESERSEVQKLILDGSQNMKYVNNYTFDIDPQGNVVATNDDRWMTNAAEPSKWEFNLGDMGLFQVYGESGERFPGVLMKTYNNEPKIKATAYNYETEKIETNQISTFSIAIYDAALTSPIAERLCNINNFLNSGDDPCEIEDLGSAAINLD